MIDLTPLDVRKKRGDFGKRVRGFDPEEVDAFLELVAERMEVLVKENFAFREEIEQLEKRVVVQEGREQAVQEALVTAQVLRQDVEKQARREAELMEREARTRVKGMIVESEKLLVAHGSALEELERQRERFLKAFRTFLERELDTVEVELGRAPLWKGSWPIAPDGDEAHDEVENEAENDDAGTDEDAAAEGADAPDAAAPDGDEADDEAENEAENDDAATDEDAADADEDNAADQDAAADDQPASRAVGGGTREDHDQASEGKEGDDSLWLSSIIKDENAE